MRNKTASMSELTRDVITLQLHREQLLVFCQCLTHKSWVDGKRINKNVRNKNTSEEGECSKQAYGY